MFVKTALEMNRGKLDQCRLKQMQLYETQSRNKQEIRPSSGEIYRFYCCGPTVYGPAHIGNFRTFVVQDTFRRVLELSGQPTCHVRNLTDVDDKTIRDSQAGGKTLGEFTQFWTLKFHQDCEALNLLPPHHEPSAVGHIPQQIALIEELMEKGHAYRSEDGSVYYRVSSFPQYGRLSHLDEREITTSSAAATAVSADEYEKDALADFALWKGRKPEDGDNYWDSPWGQGRPGWHLECSAMCREYLGDTFDLHSGGVDLIFPHHENEIAQSEAATGKPFALHWFHITHLLVDGHKMSKSLGNLYTLEQLKEKGHTAEEVRYVLISGLYRQPLNFTLQSLDDAGRAIQRLVKFEAALRQAAGEEVTGLDYESLKGLEDKGSFGGAFNALLDDLNTPDALGKMFSALKEVNPASLSPEDAARELKGFHLILEALGLKLPALPEQAEAPEEVKALAEERWKAKQEKNWAAADAARDALASLGWEVKDGREGYELCHKD